jgi:hypothetical protein
LNPPDKEERPALQAFWQCADFFSKLQAGNSARKWQNASMTRHCHKCGWEWTLAGQPGRSESCHQCGADLRVCLNCVSYDARAAQQCRDRRADPVFDKHVGNFCEYFDFARRKFAAKDEKNIREDAARERMKKLFGD